MKNKVYITKHFDNICASHNLKNYEGKCSNLHGHNYSLEIMVSRPIDFASLNEDSPSLNAMTMDFGKLKEIVREYIIDKIDHTHLNYIYTFTTAEFMVVDIFNTLKPHLEDRGVTLERVKLWETTTSFAEYRGEVL